MNTQIFVAVEQNTHNAVRFDNKEEMERLTAGDWECWVIGDSEIADNEIDDDALEHWHKVQKLQGLTIDETSKYANIDELMADAGMLAHGVMVV